RIYSRLCVAMAAGNPGLHAFSHVTGGGLAANLARVIPQGLAADVARDAWELPAIFATLQAAGRVPWGDLEATLNMGVGMIAIVAEDDADEAVDQCEAAGVHAWSLGGIRVDDDRAAGPDVVRGGKGVDGGAVCLSGAYRTR